MNLNATRHAHCQADHYCHRMPCFEAQLEAHDGPEPVRRNAELCADHLGNMVQSLTAWARNCGLTHGHVIVLAIDPSWPVRTADQARRPRMPPRAIQFAEIPLE